MVTFQFIAENKRLITKIMKEILHHLLLNDSVEEKIANMSHPIVKLERPLATF